MDYQPDTQLRKVNTANRWLLVSLLVSLLVLPLLEGLYAGRILLLVGLTSTLILGAMAARERFRLMILVLLIMVIPLTWATLFVDWRPLFVAHCVLGGVFFWIVAGVVIFVAIMTPSVTGDSVFGAISGFLLLGLAWALSYWALHTVTPNSFRLPEVGSPTPTARVPDFSQFIYYSFVTMTTLGFGDMTPISRVSRTLSWMQAVTGQFYVAVIIAWLVGALPRPK